MDLGSLQLYVKSAFDEAAASYGRALEIATEIDDQEACGDCLTRLGEVYLAEGRLEDAERELRTAAGMWRTFADDMTNQLIQRRRVYTVNTCDDIDRVQFFDDHADTYISLTRTLLAADDAAKSGLGALFAAEDGRAVTMRELLSLGATDLLAEEAAANASDLLAEDGGEPPAVPLRTAAPALCEAEELTTLLGRLFPTGEGVVLFYMLVEEPLLGAPAEGPPPPPKRGCAIWVLSANGDVRVVKTDAAAVEGKRGVGELVQDLFVKMAVAADGSLARGEVRSEEAVAQYRDHLTSSGVELPEEGAPEVDTELQALAAVLLDPIAELIPAGVPVCVVAHAELHLVPFAALPTPSGEPLGVAHPLSYAPSLTALKLLLDREEGSAAARASSSRLVVGGPSAAAGLELPPFPGAAAEAERVAACVGAEAEELLLGPAAKLDTVLERLKDSPVGLLHLAAASCAKWVALTPAEPPAAEGEFALGEQPPEPAEAEGKGEGLLVNDDLHLTWLPAHPTVVLSGNSCAYGDLSDDWVLGLPRTFLISGARSVVSALWEADDEASASLMTAWYSVLRESPETTQAEALRAAMKTVREEEGGKWRHPYFWAGYTLMGAAAGI